MFNIKTQVARSFLIAGKNAAANDTVLAGRDLAVICGVNQEAQFLALANCC